MLHQSALACSLVVFTLAGCSGRSTPQPHPSPSQHASQATHESTLHNVLRVTPKLISGSVPESAEGFDELQAMGIHTIISVDGATPDVAAAEARGMRYVHLPFGYNGIDKARQIELARAVRDLDGPIYLHCHHGKHRGPAGAAAAAIILGEMTPEEGIEFLTQAGTSANYTGLYACVTRAEPLDTAAIDSASNAFPSIAPVPGFVAAMVDAQSKLDHLEAISKANWTAPADHPDLVPLDEAGQLTDLLRAARQDTHDSSDPDDFAKHLLASIEASQSLEAAMLANHKPTDLNALLKIVATSCKDCHTKYRDHSPVANGN